MVKEEQAMIVHQSAKTKIEWIAEGKVVRKTFDGFVFGEEMRQAFNAGTAVLKKNKSSKWLSDNRNLKVYKQEDSDWNNQVWFPQIKQAGWKYWAVLEPKDYYGSMSMSKFIKSFGEVGLVLRVFHEVDEAIAWLQNVDQKTN